MVLESTTFYRVNFIVGSLVPRPSMLFCLLDCIFDL